MGNKVEIYKTTDNKTAVQVQFEKDTVWLSQKQMGKLYEKDSDTISFHIINIYKSGELDEQATTEESSVVRLEGKRQVRRKIKYYNLDVIISVGYRINSKRGIQFRQWATQRLRDYLVQGYAINEERLKQKDLKIETLKTGIRIINRAMETEMDNQGNTALKLFSRGLELLDDYDHEKLDARGRTNKAVNYPTLDEYLNLIQEMQSDYESNIFARQKDDSFDSSINQIRQQFSSNDIYPTLEEKAANLLYFITKNHSFVDGNKRIAAACFLYFLQRNDFLFNSRKEQIISSEALATLTLFIASSRPEEASIVKRIVISILNRNNL